MVSVLLDIKSPSIDNSDLIPFDHFKRQ